LAKRSQGVLGFILGMINLGHILKAKVKKRKQQYKQSAQDAIAQSFKSLGIP